MAPIDDFRQGQGEGWTFSDLNNGTGTEAEVAAEIERIFGPTRNAFHGLGFREGDFDWRVQQRLWARGRRDEGFRHARMSRDAIREMVRQVIPELFPDPNPVPVPPVPVPVTPRQPPSVAGWGPAVSRVRMTPEVLRHEFNSVHGVTGGIWTHMMKHMTTNRSSGVAFGNVTPTPPPAPAAPPTPPPATTPTAPARQQNAPAQPAPVASAASSAAAA